MRGEQGGSAALGWLRPQSTPGGLLCAVSGLGPKWFCSSQTAFLGKRYTVIHREINQNDTVNKMFGFGGKQTVADNKLVKLPVPLGAGAGRGPGVVRTPWWGAWPSPGPGPSRAWRPLACSLCAPPRPQPAAPSHFHSHMCLKRSPDVRGPVCAGRGAALRQGLGTRHMPETCAPPPRASVLSPNQTKALRLGKARVSGSSGAEHAGFPGQGNAVLTAEL